MPSLLITRFAHFLSVMLTAKVANIVMTFGDITDGRAGSFVLEQGGSKLTARRIP